MMDAEKFREWNAFLRENCSVPNGTGLPESPENAEETSKVLHILRDNNAEYDPKQGKTSVSYDNYLGEVEALLNFEHEKTDKILKPYLDAGLFKLAIDREKNTRMLICNDPGKLESEISKLENLKSYGIMTDLLKAMASN